MVGDIRAEADDDEVDVLRQPADSEYHHDLINFANTTTIRIIIFTICTNVPPNIT